MEHHKVIQEGNGAEIGRAPELHKHSLQHFNQDKDRKENNISEERQRERKRRANTSAQHTEWDPVSNCP